MKKTLEIIDSLSQSTIERLSTSTKNRIIKTMTDYEFAKTQLEMQRFMLFSNIAVAFLMTFAVIPTTSNEYLWIVKGFTGLSLLVVAGYLISYASSLRRFKPINLAVREVYSILLEIEERSKNRLENYGRNIY